jgi:hypothetical protein
LKTSRTRDGIGIDTYALRSNEAFQRASLSKVTQQQRSLMEQRFDNRLTKNWLFMEIGILKERRRLAKPIDHFTKWLWIETTHFR